MDAAVFDVGDHRFTVGDLDADDAADLIDLHRRIFGSDADANWHHWKYRAGTGVGARDKNGRLIAHCGGVPRQVIHAGREIPAVQIGDVMAAPEVRGWLTRRGPFFQVSRRYYDSRVGANRPYHLAFGFPNERHLRLGVHLGLLHDGGDILELCWPAQQLPLHFWRYMPLTPDTAGFTRAAATAWSAMRASLNDRTAGSRDIDYLRWRYIERPARDYRLFVLHRRWSPRPAGIFVLRRESAERMAWLDWIGSVSLLPVAVKAARSHAASTNADTLAVWASPAVTAALQDTGISGAQPVARLGIPSTSLLSPAEIASTNWWWMGGDTDFL